MDEDSTMVQLPKDLHEQLKIRGIQLKKSLKELVKEIVSEWLGRLA